MYNNLRKIRKEKKVSVEEFAKLIERTENVFYKKEMGLIPFTLEEAKLVADRLKKTIDYIFFKE